MSRIPVRLRGGLLLAAGLLLVACSSGYQVGGGGQAQQDTRESQDTLEQQRARASSGLVGISFEPAKGFSERATKNVPSYTVSPGSDSVTGTLYFSTTGQVLKSHFAVLLNFQPVNALVNENGSLTSSVLLDPPDRGTLRLELNLPVKALRPGTNCLLFIVQEDEHEKRLELRLRPITRGYRVDVKNGPGVGAAGCPKPSDHPDILTTTEKENDPGIFDPALSISSEKIQLRQRVKWQEIQDGRLYAYYSGVAGYGEQEGAFFLMADGQLYSVGGHPLLSRVRMVEGETVKTSFPVPRPSGTTAIVAFFAPLTDRTTDSIPQGPLEMMPKPSWQMVISPD